jgi:hypothetical protein
MTNRKLIVMLGLLTFTTIVMIHRIVQLFEIGVFKLP